jgi:hypothetical protein
MELVMRALVRALGAAVAAAGPAAAGELVIGARGEIRHAAKGHEVHTSGPAVAVLPDGIALVAWAAQEGHGGNHLYVARPGEAPVRVNGGDLTVDSLHHPPRIAAAPDGTLYVSWSSAKPKPEGTLFASDLRLSRSPDGGRTFDHHLRVNEDRPMSHSFDGLAVAPDGTVLVSWIDGRGGGANPATYVARVTERGTRVDGVARVGDETCVCCRVDAAAGPNGMVALAWRRVFPDDIRDMVLALSRDGGRSFAAPALVHADRWKITACPHRGGSVGIDGRGRVYAAWYTEGTQGRPDLYLAVSDDGRRFGPRQRVHLSTTAIPDHARLAVDRGGRAAVIWEESTAVRRRVLLRYTADGGRTLSPVRALSTAIKARMPAVAAAPDGGLVVAWDEERFPSMVTVVQAVRLGKE